MIRFFSIRRLLGILAKAKKALSEKFSLKELHNAVVRIGEVPLDVLATALGEWIATQS